MDLPAELSQIFAIATTEDLVDAFALLDEATFDKIQTAHMRASMMDKMAQLRNPHLTADPELNANITLYMTARKLQKKAIRRLKSQNVEPLEQKRAELKAQQVCRVYQMILPPLQSSQDSKR